MNLAPSRRTLIIQPLPGIGDMVWHLPHLHAIAATTVSGRIDLLTKPRSQTDRLLCADSTVERVLWLDRAAAHAGMRGLLRLTTLLRQGGYQRVWILHGSARYALAALLAGIPERIGYGVGWQTALLNGPVRLPPELRHTHPIQRADALLDLLNIPCAEPEPLLQIAAEADQAVTERFAAWPLPWIALGIGSSEPWKQWGAVRFAELALALHQQQAGSIFIVGGSAERALADELLTRIHASGGQAADAVASPLEQTAALLARCRAYLGNDTGVLNMAAALQTPAFGLFGGSQPLWHSCFIYPITPPESEAGMAGITVPQVLDRYLQLGQLHAHQDGR
ncbi:MAG: glycosyltransferase family 9 protein [Candidatus Contendobacter sp.]|nr:glycosyltransferase family 9 protein [Gammaproteobacteria bacterium]MCC8993358.1 glycosyltransferase family 9 protein [Candidatus Contendobacter sp.]